MTYEGFTQRVLEEGAKANDTKVTRKSIRNMTIRLMLIFAEVGIATGYLISCVLKPVAVFAGLVIFVALTYMSLEYIAVSDNTVYTKWNKFSKFWWLGLILMIIAVLAIRLNLK